MKKMILLAVTVFCFAQADAQSDSLKWVKEINEEVWKPFIAHFISGNKEGFRNVHSKRITWVEIDKERVLDYEKYFPPVNPSGKKPSPDFQRLFELRFDKRISDGTKAWESGYFKGTVIRAGQDPSSYYGRFFVVLEKEEGVWKILVDADTAKEANGGNFSKASAMEKN